MNLVELAKSNEKSIKENVYPGRGIITGMTPDGRNMVQVYWIMGRSENSRNRVFEQINGFVRTKAYDEKKLVDPSLIIYYPVKHYRNSHIVSNGDQTDTIFDCLVKGETFEKALSQREFEPDSPNFTPRISGIIDLDDSSNAYKLSILKTMNNNPAYGQKMFFCYTAAIPGFGHFITTYNGDGNPIPSFTGEPKPVSIFNGIDEAAEYYWDLLNIDNRISLLVKFIDIKSREAKIKIINKYLE
jgi:hypothetical protein